MIDFCKLKNTIILRCVLRTQDGDGANMDFFFVGGGGQSAQLLQRAIIFHLSFVFLLIFPLFEHILTLFPSLFFKSQGESIAPKFWEDGNTHFGPPPPWTRPCPQQRKQVIYPTTPLIQILIPNLIADNKSAMQTRRIDYKERRWTCHARLWRWHNIDMV